MPKLIEFNTDRLQLRQWCLADREPFSRLNADAKVMAYFSSPLDRAASDTLADRCRSLITERGWGFWAVETRDTHAFIGFVGLHIPSDVLPFSPCVEIGWRLAGDYWGRGLATEAAKGALQVGFEELDLPEIVSFTVFSNSRSRRVMERLGMRDTSTVFEHPAIAEGHPLRVHCLYRLSRENWRLLKCI
ncbi:MAG: GNAT family N-acetyltransferase [Candidatus Thiodiazotropha sp. (ex Epidulcina cf. delphinae)]|nr:GNAT family N-acetyltransferase [Candidatus Thiodiazotropha sp. (ex Epidulcina cf. delphinae)]